MVVSRFGSRVTQFPDAETQNAMNIGVRRQILQVLWSGWRQDIATQRKCRVAAMVRLQKALRMVQASQTGGADFRWTPELASIIFHMCVRTRAAGLIDRQNTHRTTTPAHL